MRDDRSATPILILAVAVLVATAIGQAYQKGAPASKRISSAISQSPLIPRGLSNTAQLHRVAPHPRYQRLLFRYRDFEIYEHYDI